MKMLCAYLLRRRQVVLKAGLCFVVGVVVLLASCVTPSVPDVEPPESILRSPDLLGHKNQIFDRPVPDWVVLSQAEIERAELYPGRYVFKLESPRAQNLEAAQIWTRNFEAASRVSQSINTRVRVKFAGAAAGDLGSISNYFEQVVDSLSDVEIAGLRLETDYWVQNRYYNPDGSENEIAYTYILLYTIPQNILDTLVQNALDDAAVGATLSVEQEQVRDRVEEAFADGL